MGIARDELVGSLVVTGAVGAVVDERVGAAAWGGVALGGGGIEGWVLTIFC